MSGYPVPQRRSPRLQGYDYAQAGAYFVTICTHNRAHLFGTIVDGVMVLNHAGKIAEDELVSIPEYWPQQVELEAFVVMPNHVHAILVLVGTAFLPSAAKHPAPATDTQKPDTQKRVPTLGTVVGNYKSGVTRRVREAQGEPELRVWQGRYYDHIIRSEAALNRIREYIMYNPARWREDTLYGEPPGKIAL